MIKIFTVLLLTSQLAFTGDAQTLKIVDSFDRPPVSTAAYGLAVLPPNILFAVGVGMGPDGLGRWIVRRSTDGGKTWITIDSFQPHPGLSARANSVAVDRRGTVYVLGQYTDPSNRIHHLLRQSSDLGRSWLTTDDYTHPDKKMIFNRAYRVYVSPQGYVYTLTQVYDSLQFPTATVETGVIRRSLDGGRTWKTFNECSPCEEGGIVVDVRGNVLVAGAKFISMTPKPSKVVATVRMISHDGKKEKLLDQFGNPKSASVWIGISMDRNENLWVTGISRDAFGRKVGVIRQGSFSGWQTMDVFSYGQGTDTVPYQVIEAPKGGFVQAGYAIDAGQRYHWLIRRSDESGTKWRTIADEVGPTGFGALGLGIDRNFATGEIFVNGAFFLNHEIRGWRVGRIE